MSTNPPTTVPTTTDFCALPSYTSHKVVKAAEIDGVAPVHPPQPADCSSSPEQYQVGLVVRGGPGAGDMRYVVTVPAGVFARGMPANGDYLVVYEGNYVSWSPKKAFEEGYSRDAD